MDIDTMEAGRELDERIAVEIFGEARPPYVHTPHIDPIRDGVWYCLPDYDEGDYCHWRALDFSGDMSTAWRVVRKMREMPVHTRSYFMRGLQFAIEGRLEIGASWEDVLMLVEPEDICRAALKAVGSR